MAGFWSGFAEGFKDVQDKNFARDMKQEERDYLDKVRKEEREFESQQREADAIEKRRLFLLDKYYAGGGGRRGSGGGGQGGGASGGNAEAALEWAANTFGGAAQTPEDQQAVQEYLVKLQQNPETALAVYENYKSRQGDDERVNTFDPMEVVRNSQFYNLSDPNEAVMSLEEVLAAAESPESMEAALGQMGQGQGQAEVVLPQNITPKVLEPEAQAGMMLTRAVELATREMAENTGSEDFSLIQDLIERAQADGPAGEIGRLRLLERYSAQLSEELRSGDFDVFMKGWENNPYIPESIRLSAVEDTPVEEPVEDAPLEFSSREEALQAKREGRIPPGSTITILNEDGTKQQFRSK